MNAFIWTLQVDFLAKADVHHLNDGTSASATSLPGRPGLGPSPNVGSEQMESGPPWCRWIPTPICSWRWCLGWQIARRCGSNRLSPESGVELDVNLQLCEPAPRHCVQHSPRVTLTPPIRGAYAKIRKRRWFSPFFQRKCSRELCLYIELLCS